MSCLVTRDNNTGNILEVKASNGNRSRAFDKINSIPFFGDADFSYKVLSNLYSPKIEQIYAGVSDSQFVYEDSLEPRIFVRDSKGSIRESIEQSIVENNTDFFELGVLNPEDSSFVRIAKFNPNISAKSKGVLNGIAEGLISPERVLTVTGEVRFKGKGIYKADILMGARLFKDNFERETGIPVTVYSDGTLTVNDLSNFTPIEKSDGGVEIIHESEAADFIRNKKNIVNKPEVVAISEDLLLKPYKFDDSIPSTPQVMSEKMYLKMTNSFFNSLGFTATTMQSYNEAFKNRHGQDTDVTALIDLGNRVVAIAEGGNVVDNVTEELAHLAVETYADQGSILGALSEIHTTPEYSQWAQIYRQKYSSQYSGIELEDAVRKEILGKVMAKEVKNNFFESEQRQTIWNRVVNYLRSVFTPSHRRTIDKISRDIASSIKSGKTDMFSETRIQKDGVYYSVKELDGKIATSLEDAARTINSLANLAKTSGSRGVRTDIRNLPKTLNEYELVEYSRKLVDPLFTNLEILKARIAKREISHIDKVRIDTIKGLVETNIPNLIQALKDIDSGALAESAKFVSSKMEALGTELIKVSSEFSTLDSEGFNKLLNEVSSDNGFNEEQRTQLEELFPGTMKDVSRFASTWGVISESSNPFLSLLGHLSLKMRTRVNRRAQKTVTELSKEAVDKGWDNKDVQEGILEKDADGKLTGYLFTAVNQGAKDAAERKFIISEISTRLGVSESEAEKLFDSKPLNDIFEKQEDLNSFRTAERDFNRKHTGMMFQEKYYEEKDELHKVANTSEYTIEELSNDYLTINEIRRDARYINEDGSIDRTRMTEEDKIIMDSELARLKSKKSALDHNLNIKEGLRIVKVSDLTEEEKANLPHYNNPEMREYFNEALNKSGDKIILPSVPLSELSNDSRYVLDVFNMNFARRIQFTSEPQAKVSDNLINILEEFESEGDFGKSLEFLVENGAIGLTDDYYENLSGSKSIVDQVQERYEEIKEEDRVIVQDLIDNYSELSTKRSEFLKSYRSSRNAFQINAQNISAPERDKFKELESDLAGVRRSLKARLKKSGIELDTPEISQDIVLSANEAFENEYKTSSYKTRLDFMLSEMSENNADDVRQFKIYATQQLTYENPPSTKRFDNIISRLRETEQYNKILEIEDTNAFVNELTSLYAVEKLPAYFQERVPSEWENLVNSISTGEVRLSEKLKGGENLGQNVTISPNYTWTELSQNKDFINPYYKKAFGGKQPKFSLYKNESFFNTFGITEQDWLDNDDITTIESTKNQKTFEYYKTMLNLRKKSDSLMGYEGNIYQAIQQSTTLWQKIKSSTKAGGLKSAAKDYISDVLMNKVDEMEYGESLEGGVNVPPRMFRKKLEDPNAITRDTLSAFLLDYAKAEEYKVRNEMMGQFYALLTKAEETKFSDESMIRSKARIVKAGQTSEVAKRVKEQIDYMIFGVKQSRRMEIDAFGKTIDLTRLIDRFRGFSVFNNLAYNPLVATTSLTTGYVNRKIDKLSGEIYSTQAQSDAEKLIWRDIPKYLTEDGKLNADSRLNTIMEGFGMKGVQTRFNESSSSRVGRLATEASGKLDELANLPVTPVVLYSVLHDTRMVEVDNKDGVPVYRMLSFDNYKAFAKSSGMNTKAEINAGWKKTKPFFELINTKNGFVEPTEEYLQHFTKESFNSLVDTLGSRALQQAQRVDGVLTDADRTTAGRDVLMNLVMQHKSWLALVLPQQWKKGGFNFTRGKFEEGYVRTGIKFFKELAQNYKDPVGFINHWKNSAKEHEKANMRRLVANTAVWGALLGLCFAFKASDDDDDPFIEDFARIITYRTLGEIQSGNFIGSYSTIKGALESPVTALSTFDNQYKLLKALGSINSDKYAADLYDAFNKATIFRRYTQLNDLEGYTQGWVWFNKEELPYLYNK